MLLNSVIIKNGKEINAALIVTKVVRAIVFIYLRLYAKIAETTYPKAAIIIANLGKKFPDCLEEILTKESKPKINRQFDYRVRKANHHKSSKIIRISMIFSSYTFV